MAEWMMGIVGVVCLGVLLDLIIPEGQTNKYIKGVFAIIIIFVIVSPLPKLIGGEFVFPEVALEQEENLLKSSDVTLECKQSELDRLLRMYGFEAESKIVANSDLSNIERVYVTLANTGLSEETKNIYISRVKAVVVHILGVDENIVMVRWRYG